VYLHICHIRTINTRFGYSDTIFKHRKKPIQWGIYLSGLPVVLLDWECARNFSFFLAQTFCKFWPIIFLLKASIVASIWIVIGIYMDYGNHWEYYGWLGLSLSTTVLALCQFGYFLKLWAITVYLVPFTIYWIVYLFMLPFMACCSCARYCMGREKKQTDKPEELGEDNSNKIAEFKNDGEYEGGDDEEEYNTARNVNSDGYYGRAEAYRDDEENRYVETDANIAGTKKKKMGKNAKKAKKTSKPKEKNAKSPTKRDMRRLEDLYFFPRVWRCLHPKY
jgi:hypothetical protein